MRDLNVLADTVGEYPCYLRSWDLQYVLYVLLYNSTSSNHFRRHNYLNAWGIQPVHLKQWFSDQSVKRSLAFINFKWEM
jgi:hypothetical protein